MIIRREQMKQLAKSGNPTVLPCGNKPFSHAIEIVLVDQQNKPVGGARYRVTLSDGSERIGNLDADGFVRFDKIPEGICLVRFPDVDGTESGLETSEYMPGAKPEEKKKAPPPASVDKRHWLELKVVDAKGKAQGFLEYEVTLPDGSLRKGALDGAGFARLEDLPAGKCKVRFPGDLPQGYLELQTETTAAAPPVKPS